MKNLYLEKILRSPEGDGNTNGQEKEETPPTTPRDQMIQDRTTPPPAPKRARLERRNDPQQGR